MDGTVSTGGLISALRILNLNDDFLGFGSCRRRFLHRLLIKRICNSDDFGAVSQSILRINLKLGIAGVCINPQIKCAILQCSVEGIIHINADNAGTQIIRFHMEKIIPDTGGNGRTIIIKEVHYQFYRVFLTVQVCNEKVHDTVI